MKTDGCKELSQDVLSVSVAYWVAWLDSPNYPAIQDAHILALPKLQIFLLCAIVARITDKKMEYINYRLLRCLRIQ